MTRMVTLTATLIVALLALTALATPKFIHYNGVLMQAGVPVPDGDYMLTFRVYEYEVDHSPIWSEVQNPVATKDGKFNVKLGSINELTTDVFSSDDRWLGIEVGTDGEMTPRTPIGSVPYAFMAGNVADRAIDSNKIALKSIKHENIKDKAIDSLKIADKSIKQENIKDGAITSAIIANGTILFEDIASNGATSSGKIMKWDGDSWELGDDNVGAADNDWTLTGGVLFTAGEWGIARAGNTLHGLHDSTHVNLGGASQTGTGGKNYVYATVAGGWSNSANGSHSSVGGGQNNRAWGGYATVAGGLHDTASGDYASIGGGSVNSATGFGSVIAGGNDNQATDTGAAVGGGSNNRAEGIYATIPGGWMNEAKGDRSFAAGSRAEANHDGAVVISSTVSRTSPPISSAFPGEMVLRADSLFYLTDGITLAGYPGGNPFLYTSTGAFLSKGGVWQNASDKHLKENFTPVDGREILEKITLLPIMRWNYQTEDDQTQHIGPVSQDFYTVFGVGGDDKTISTIDPSGIALAAIQELYERSKEQQQTIEELREKVAKVDDLKAQMKQLQSLVETLLVQKNVTGGGSDKLAVSR
ncbi:MAG: tail fiber domain-containing protein [bacterium]